MMTIVKPEFEIVNRSIDSIRYLEHGWPSPLCRWHAHKEYELHLITSTEGKVIIGNYIGRFKAGDLFLVGSLLPHNWSSYENQPTVENRDKLIQFDCHNIFELATLFPEYKSLKPLLTEAKSGIQFLNYDSDKAEESLNNLRDYRGAKRMNYFLELLADLAQHKDKKLLSLGVEFSKISEVEEIRINNIVEYVFANYNEKITTQNVAKICGVSIHNFSRYFHNHTGSRFNEFINKIRISQACNLLQQSHKNISTICYETGFNNISHFNRYFLREKGLTPREYRNQMRINIENIQ